VEPGGRSREASSGDALLLVLWNRIGLWITGFLAASLLPSVARFEPQHLNWLTTHHTLLDIWTRWDGQWYLLIAERGYGLKDLVASWGWPAYGNADAGFFPLYPWLVAAFKPLLGTVGAALLVSNLSLAGAAFLLFRLVGLELSQADDAAGRRGTAGLVAVAALLAWPMSLFLSAAYSESLFLLLALGVMYLARRGRFTAAAAVGFAAAMARPYGVILALPLAVEALSGPRGGRLARSASALGPVAGLGAVMLWYGRVFGDPLAFLHRQEAWRGTLGGPWNAFVRWWQAGPAVHGGADSTIELCLALFILALLPLMFRYLRPSYLVYMAVLLELSLGSTLWSFGRLVLGMFPVFVLAGILWEKGWNRAVTSYLLVGTVLSAFFMTLFATWWWVG